MDDVELEIIPELDGELDGDAGEDVEAESEAEAEAAAVEVEEPGSPSLRKAAAVPKSSLPA